MIVESTKTFEIEGAYDLGDIARMVGEKLGGKFIADSIDDVLNGYVTQQVYTTPDGVTKSVVTVYFYQEDEDAIIPEAVKDNDPAEVKEQKMRLRQFAHHNKFRKLNRPTDELEVDIEDRINEIKSGRIKVRSIEKAVKDAVKNEPKRRKAYLAQIGR